MRSGPRSTAAISRTGNFSPGWASFSGARRLTARDLQLLFRLDIQLAADPLLPLEQVGVGGRYSVRGYRENQLVRDNALIASLESRIPLVRNRRWADYVQVVPFVDVGRGWNRQAPDTGPDDIGQHRAWACAGPLVRHRRAAAPAIRGILGL